jgi:predicted MFS family arabinose efflux permease
VTTVVAPEAPAGRRAPLRGWLAVAAVTLGIFALMTSELLPVGLLTPVGHAFGVSEGVAGLMVTVPGLVAAATAPLVTVATGRLDRRLVLAVLVGLVGAANLASAFAGGIGVMLAARVLIGVAVGGFWSLAGGLALRLVPERQVPRATAVIFGGVETASVLGVPAGTLAGDLAGWRAAFAAVGALGLLSLVLLVLLLPPLPPRRTLALPDLPRVLRANGALRSVLAGTFLVVTAHFLAYTFVRPVLQDGGVGDRAVGVLLLVFGVAGICGNFAAGALVARDLRRTVAGICLTLAAAVALLAAAAQVPPVVPLVLWGLAYGAVPVTFQTWVTTAEPRHTEAASSLFVSVFNLSIALGALVGGLVVDTVALRAALWVGCALALPALLLSVPRRRPV